MIKSLTITVLSAMISLYRLVISPWLGENCRFYPTCSVYAQEAIEKHGPLKGVWLVLKRVVKCNPWHRCDFHDPVP